MRSSGAADLPREADRILLTKFAPPSVLVSANLEILQYRGDTGAYLAPAPGKASLSLLKMLREGLLVAVRTAILRAGKEQVAVREEGLQVKTNGGYHEVAVEVIPLKRNGADESGFLILFEEAGMMSAEQPPSKNARNRKPDAPSPEPTSALDSDVARLEQELTATREYLQSVIQEQEAANEGLQSANEEVQSANEELQSINEELETSKEEIQSSNEELATVNDELNNRNIEMNRINNDLVNLLGSVQMAIVMLGPDLRVRRFTPAAEKLLNLIPTDVGRPLGDIKLNIDLPDLEPLLTEVFDKVGNQERDVRDQQGRWYSLRLRPYKTLDNKIDGVVMILVDVDAAKRAHAFTSSIVATVRESLLVLDQDLRVQTASRSFYESFRLAAEDVENQLLYELSNGQWNIPDLRRLLEEVLSQGNPVHDFEVERAFEHIGIRTMLLNARRLIQTDDQALLILLAIEDVTERNHAKKALRESEQRYRALFDLGPVAVYSCDLSGTIKDFNRRAVELWGREPDSGDTDERFCGSLKLLRPDGTFVPHDHCPMAEVLCGKISAARGVEVLIERPDGSRIAVIVNIVSLKNEHGDITGAINCFYDITERKQAENLLRESEQRLASLIASSNDAIISISLDGIIQSWNSSAERLFGYTAEQAVGCPISLIIPPDHAGEMQRLLERIKAGERIDHFDTVRVRRDGQRIQVSLTISPIKNAAGQIIGASKIARDITERKRLESELRRSATELAAADRHKDEFLAMLAHELRNPLAPISYALQALKVAGADPRKSVRLQAMMERQIQNMSRLIDDLLDLSRINQGKVRLQKEHVDLRDVLKEVAETAEHYFQGRAQELTVSLPPEPIYLEADPTRLAQVFGNLLNNASKYNNRGGHVWLTAERADGVGIASSDTVIRVRDDGIGITPDQLPRIFDMFTQVDQTLERSQGGIGIGLTLVKNLVEMHGGAVEAHSSGLGRGSEFVVRLPVLGQPLQPALLEEPPGNEKAKICRWRILVVEDNWDAAESLALLLTMAGHEVHTAHDGEEALEAAPTFRPEVVLLDIGLPKLNGYEVCRRIREQPGGKEMVVVALTGWGQEEERRKTRDGGFDHHLLKPVDMDALQGLLTRLSAAT